MDTRLYVHYAAAPAFNMGFDEWMLARASVSPQSLYCRIYSWKPGAITFGVNQRQDTALDFTKIGQTTVIRRITGGRAIFHDESELTYSIAFNSKLPVSPLLAGTSAQSSQVIAELLAKLLGGAGIRADWVRRSANENARPDFFHKAACFASHAKYELSTGGAKIVASARRELQSAVLQHGSIKLRGYVPHPALYHQPIDSGTTESLDLSTLNAMADRLEQTVLDHLDVSLKRIPESNTPESELIDAVSRVRTNPLGKREIVAQEQGVASH